jgi:hypothetical protein
MAIPVSWSCVTIKTPAGAYAPKPHASLDVELAYDGAVYVGTLTRKRSPLPNGATWEGDEIVWDGRRYTVVAAGAGSCLRVSTSGRESSIWATPLWVIDAFRAEGLL